MFSKFLTIISLSAVMAMAAWVLLLQMLAILHEVKLKFNVELRISGYVTGSRWGGSGIFFKERGGQYFS